MAIASQLPKRCDTTIVARNLPGDPDSHEWASPWAGAVWMIKLPSNKWEQKMQLEAFRGWWKLAYTNPESSVRRIEMWDLVDFIPQEQIWYKNKLPGFRILSKEELPEGAPFGMAYKSIVLTPPVFLPWMRRRLEGSGVKFQRMTVSSLSDLEGMGHDVLVNASGVGARDLLESELQRLRIA
jgi:D-amino-acid oxidase